MSPVLPDGEAAPRDGSLPGWVAGPRSSRFGVYLHVPFCSVRCGYCDFNTYTATELGGGASQIAYAETSLAEIELAGRSMRAAGLPGREVSTVFVGGGTPTMLPASDLIRMLDGVRDTWGLAAGAEVSTEANPDSVTPESLAALAAGGFTRVSFGMQSSVPHVLATLERTHDPQRVPDVVRWARDAGLAVSLDLIYGTPGESLDDWRRSLDTVVETGVDHVSAYALVVEPGTKMGAQVRRGELELPSGDDQAEKYEIADAILTDAGLAWYEVSNWSRTPELACQHNLAYWRGDDWWGVGPGAHSYIGPSSGSSVATDDDFDTLINTPDQSAGVRWWNVKHPRRYAALLESGETPAAGRERLSYESAQLERVMLGIRLREGLDLAELTVQGRHAIAGLVADGLLEGRAAIAGRAVLTLRGRLLADAVVRTITD